MSSQKLNKFLAIFPNYWMICRIQEILSTSLTGNFIELKFIYHFVYRIKKKLLESIQKEKIKFNMMIKFPLFF